MPEQKYYFKIGEYPAGTETKKLKEFTRSAALGIANNIGRKVLEITHSREIYLYWTSRNTFGYIFTDFEKPKAYRNVIGKGRKQLFQKIKEDYYCVVLSNSLPHNFRTINIDDGKTGIIINIDFFKRFSEVIRYENFVGLFLYKFDNEEVSKIIRSWITDSPERFKKLIDEEQIAFTDVATVLEQFKIESLTELSDFLSSTTKIIRSRLEGNYKLFETKLEEFKSLLDKEKQLEEKNYDGRKHIENEIRDFIRGNPWIIDFTYDEKSVQSEIHKDADVILVDSYLNLKKAVIMELKVPTKVSLKEYRGEDVFKAIVPNAIGQVIRYMMEALERHKQKDDEKLFVEGLVVVARYKDKFTQIFNTFLHGITIKSYQELYEETKKRLINFAKGPNIKAL